MTFAMDDKHKCRLLDEELPAITYNSGGTYTLGALLEAQASIFPNSLLQVPFKHKPFYLESLQLVLLHPRCLEQEPRRT